MKRILSIVTLITMVLFAASVIAADKVVVVPLGGKKSVGDAAAADVLEGKTFSNKDNVGLDGTMVNNGAVTFNPGSSDQAVPKGYHNGSGMVKGDADLISSNIKAGATLFGVNGTSIEASGTATPGQVLSSQTFSNASGPATGTMTNVGAQNITPTTAAQAITQGYHNGTGTVAGDTDLVSKNIRSGTNIFGVSGDANVVNTSTGDAGASDMLTGKKAWVDGSEVTGNIPTQTLAPTTTTVQAGYYTSTNLATVDTDLVAGNIVYGVTIFGVTGTGPPLIVTSAGQIWMDRNLGASRVATSSTDPAAYGDLYQWGRLADGHQSRTSATTSTLSTTDVPGHGDFILTSGVPCNWRTPQNNSLWQGVSGINNPCPSGFRLPTETELNTERASWTSQNSAGAFGSPLKLVVAGVRNYWAGTVTGTGSWGYYWSSTVNDDVNARYLSFSSGASWYSSYRAWGMSVRCLQD